MEIPPNPRTPGPENFKPCGQFRLEPGQFIAEPGGAAPAAGTNMQHPFCQEKFRRLMLGRLRPGPGPKIFTPRKGEFLLGEIAMSDMHDAVGLRSAWKVLKETHMNSSRANGTLWGYMRQRGNPCFNLGLAEGHPRPSATIDASSGQVELKAPCTGATLRGASPTGAYSASAATWRCSCSSSRARDRDALAHYARLCIDNIVSAHPALTLAPTLVHRLAGAGRRARAADSRWRSPLTC
jgi:hypothetical protein